VNACSASPVTREAVANDAARTRRERLDFRDRYNSSPAALRWSGRAIAIDDAPMSPPPAEVRGGGRRGSVRRVTLTVPRSLFGAIGAPTYTSTTFTPSAKTRRYTPHSGHLP
jgi:hypothetical protein